MSRKFRFRQRLKSVVKKLKRFNSFLCHRRRKRR